MLRTYEKKVDQEMKAARMIRLWLSTAQYFPKQAKTKNHLMRFGCNVVNLHLAKDVWPDDGVPDERFNFIEEVEHDWGEMEIPSERREHVAATIFPEARQSARKAHRA